MSDLQDRRVPDTVVVGSLWRGITGNLMRVIEVDDGRALLKYTRIPEEPFWETRSDVVEFLHYVGTGETEIVNRGDA